MHRLLYFLLTIALCHNTFSCRPPKCKSTTAKPLPPPIKAIVRLQGPIVNGNITFTEPFYGGEVKIAGNITGLTTGKYGFHIHEKGDITGGCATTGPHFNPTKATHGAPGDEIRHIGDLGNVETDANNVTIVNITDGLITLSGANSIIGRGVVLHGREDDLGRTDHPDSKTTGNAGPRVSCGVIGIV